MVNNVFQLQIQSLAYLTLLPMTKLLICVFIASWVINWIKENALKYHAQLDNIGKELAVLRYLTTIN